MPRGCPECGAGLVAAADGIKECVVCDWSSEDTAPEVERDELYDLDDEFDQPARPSQRTKMRPDDAA